ncbi:cobalamin-binding protein [Nocardiopsis sp. TSRI0078]|uniref:helical backbone metal receptor n=1 Tax=unclassified Nocardiopsis TaxID=2649073 RepID=UPI00093DDF9A|nr:helical backbone metal receptor [Nocardiopsis sp. TSRI0078]OKI15124.1 cobalamin-binding protein [Nocardiopsis sp. TSRI0078]
MSSSRARGVPVDDLGHPVVLPDPVRRVVSLVPSLTEAIAHTAPDVLVGATVWCTRPAGLEVERLRGTKNPHVRRIADMAPDLVVANREENREPHVRELRRAGIPVWVTDIRTVPGAFASLHRLFAACALASPDWLARAEAAWSAPAPSGPRVAVPVWRDPWMWVGGDTYADDVLSRLGAVNVLAGGRYPRLAPEEAAAAGPDVVVLPDEPYRFTADDGPDAFPGLPVVLIEGRDLTWYGPSMTAARERLASVLAPFSPPDGPCGGG